MKFLPARSFIIEESNFELMYILWAGSSDYEQVDSTSACISAVPWS